MHVCLYLSICSKVIDYNPITLYILDSSYCHGKYIEFWLYSKNQDINKYKQNQENFHNLSLNFYGKVNSYVTIPLNFCIIISKRFKLCKNNSEVMYSLYKNLINNFNNISIYMSL